MLRLLIRGLPTVLIAQGLLNALLLTLPTAAVWISPHASYRFSLVLTNVLGLGTLVGLPFLFRWLRRDAPGLGYVIVVAIVLWPAMTVRYVTLEEAERVDSAQVRTMTKSAEVIATGNSASVYRLPAHRMLTSPEGRVVVTRAREVGRTTQVWEVRPLVAANESPGKLWCGRMRQGPNATQAGVPWSCGGFLVIDPGDARQYRNAVQSAIGRAPDPDILVLSESAEPAAVVATARATAARVLWGANLLPLILLVVSVPWWWPRTPA